MGKCMASFHIAPKRELLILCRGRVPIIRLGTDKREAWESERAEL